MLPAAELVSFLEQTHGGWNDRDVSKTLNIYSVEAKQAIAAMQLQGYAEPIARTKLWRTTEAGLTISGANTARLTRKAVVDGLSARRDRIQAIKNDTKAKYTISEAVAFGDFLAQDARVQPADVGIRLTPRSTDLHSSASAVQQKAKEAFLKQLRGRSAALHIQDYEQWMGARSTGKCSSVLRNAPEHKRYCYEIDKNCLTACLIFYSRMSCNITDGLTQNSCLEPRERRRGVAP